MEQNTAPVNTAHCSHNVDESDNVRTEDTHGPSESTIANEMCTKTIDLNVVRSSNINCPKSFNLSSACSNNNEEDLIMSPAPLIVVSNPQSLLIESTNISPETAMPTNLASPASFTPGQPQSLFLQALAKLNQTSLSRGVASHFNIQQLTDSTGRKIIIGNTELATPDSLASAPPSYSFVLRQMALRRRPRIVGTFIPSPSFIQHTPPPNYAAAFDIYVENPIRQPSRAYNFGFASMPVVCPDCGYAGMTIVTSKITLCTHLCAVILCILCCWVCAPLPYILRSCKEVYHYCRNCRRFLGMYRPTNPENTF